MYAVPAGVPSQGAWLVWLQAWALPFWSTGVLFFSERLALGYRHAFQLRRNGNAAGEGVIGIGHIKRYDYLVNMLQMLAETGSSIIQPCGGHPGKFALSASSAATIWP